MKVRLYTDEEINKLNNSIFVRSVKYKKRLNTIHYLSYGLLS